MHETSALLFFDVDGTLISHGGGQSVGEVVAHAKPAPAVYDAFRRLRQNGHKAFICTGRGRSMVSQALLDLEPAGLVCSAGASVYIGDEEVFHVDIDADLLRQTADALASVGAEVLFESGDRCVAFSPSGATYEGIPNTPTVHSPAELMERYPTFSCNKFCYEASEFDKIAQLEPFMSEHFDTCDLGIGTGESTLKGVNKGTGIAHVLEYLGRDRTDTYAFGDSENDLAMLGAVAHPVAMGNAMGPVKDAAAYVTDSVDDDGVVTAMEHFGLI